MTFRNHRALSAAALAVTVGAGALAGCDDNSSNTGPDTTTAAVRSKVKNVVVIYAENRSFDNLYGDFPGANGIPTDSSKYAAQVDRDGKTVLAQLPQTWGGVTVSGQDATVTQAQSAGLPNAPFSIETAFQANANGQTLTRKTVTRDLYHRFFENQMQIDGGKNDMFAAWADAGGLTMGRFATNKDSALYKLAQQNVLADNFFEGAYGGSFLNHQYLICACAPTYPNADTSASKPTITVVNLKDTTKAADFGNYSTNLSTASNSPASALSGPPVFTLSGNIAPKNYFGANDGFRAINTMQPPYQPSGNAPASSDTTHLYSDPAKATTLPAQTQTTIGDLLSAKGVSWAWYTGSWNQLTQATTGSTYAPPSSAGTAPVAPNFQYHHQPFNYYTALDPVAHADARAAHLKDYNDLISAAKSGTLPQVVWYKPEGDVNQHPGYTNVDAGDQHIANLVAALQASPQYANMVIVITYDEFGGQWDHVAPPKGDLLGPGTRIPALIISPFAKAGTVDHTQYDTASTLRFIARVFGTDSLPGTVSRDTALQSAGLQPMGDLTNALNLQ